MRAILNISNITHSIHAIFYIFCEDTSTRECVWLSSYWIPGLGWIGMNQDGLLYHLSASTLSCHFLFVFKAVWCLLSAFLIFFPEMLWFSFSKMKFSLPMTDFHRILTSLIGHNIYIVIFFISVASARPQARAPSDLFNAVSSAPSTRCGSHCKFSNLWWVTRFFSITQWILLHYSCTTFIATQIYRFPSQTLSASCHPQLVLFGNHKFFQSL